MIRKTHLISKISGALGRHTKALAALLAAGFLICASCEKKTVVAAAGPPDVDVAEVEQRDVPITHEWVGTLDGLVNAQIHAQVTGYLIKQNYTNGAFVRKGQPLFQIDPRSFQASLDQAKGNLEQAKGQLSQNQGNLQKSQAILGKTQLDVKRYTPLAKESAISQQELDDAIQANLASEAQVEADKAAIEAAKANIIAAEAALETAKINLGFTNITSPVDGVAAIATAQVGDLVGAQSGTLTTVSTVNPILVNFSPSEAEYLNAAAQIGAAPGTEDAAIKRLQFQLLLANGATYPEKGRIYAINREITQGTGTLLVQCSFPNPGNVLRPGGFARVNTVIKIDRGALVVPQIAVSDVQGSYLIALVGSDNKVSIVPVKAGMKVGTMWVITEGLKPGDRVVAEGIQKVKEGMLVNPKPYTPPQQAKPSV
ncbi:MAG: efflux RND transporter periplasmic adaptor subunit [Acidobacteriaceae bacterium]|nr:efflux RND transporter periplasmic adaptor subunit [Acidobacteriaceae bacterium]MBV8570745.1 efflux RND transporter periplasmic adaptor subunit [Acidobacteriaceae bacterium]